MLNIKLSPQAKDFLLKIQKKHSEQIAKKIKKLAQNPSDVPSEQLEGFPTLKRFKSGEYRVIYRISENILSVLVLRIGKRNDGEVYRRLDTLLDDNLEDN